MKAMLGVGSVLLGLAIAPSALADDSGVPITSRVIGNAPSRAAEFTLGVGVTQGFGDIGKYETQTLTDLSDAGGAVQFGVGYRIEPRLMLGLYGEVSGFENGDLVASDARVFGGAAGVQAQWHFSPFNLVDPWIGAGVGWHGLWVDQKDKGTLSLQGIDSLRLQVGVDYRVSPTIAISPLVGLSAVEFAAKKPAGTDEYEEIKGIRWNVYAFAGAQIRFDVGGRRSQGTVIAAR
jgi:hypothetical protein